MERWASLNDLLEVDKSILEDTLEAAYLYCYNAANLVFEYKSSTSGMYGSWLVSVSPSCTVYLQMKAPIGSGNHINSALQDFAANCRKNSEEFKEMCEKQSKETK